ncbi:MAG: hypothetical protein ACKO0W_12090, partial [Planctomycetota bacterium]
MISGIVDIPDMDSRIWVRSEGSALRSLLARAADPFAALAMAPIACVLRAIRRLGFDLFPRTRDMLGRMGAFPIADHYYDPIFAERQLTRPIDGARNLPGLDLKVEGSLRLLQRLGRCDEVRAWPDRELAGVGRVFPLQSLMYGPGDAEFLYQFLRAHPPRLIIEIGCGDSTKIIQLALEANKADGHAAARHVCVEPYENPWLERMGVEVIRTPVERAPLDLFEQLGPGDMLFVDSSHMIRPGGDVLFEFLELIPRLGS